MAREMAVQHGPRTGSPEAFLRVMDRLLEQVATQPAHPTIGWLLGREDDVSENTVHVAQGQPGTPAWRESVAPATVGAVALQGWLVSTTDPPSVGVAATDPATWGEEFDEADLLLAALRAHAGRPVHVLVEFLDE